MMIDRIFTFFVGFFVSVAIMVPESAYSRWESGSVQTKVQLLSFLDDDQFSDLSYDD